MKQSVKKRRNRRKAQVWISDYTLSFLLFTLAVLICVKIIINSFSINTTFSELKSDAAKISETLLSEGYPPEWSIDEVIRPGILSNKRINASKVYNAMSMEYSSLKPKLQTKYDFLVIFKDKNNDMIEFNSTDDTDTKCFIGSTEVAILNDTLPSGSFDCHSPDFSRVNYKNLVTITRLAVYDSNIIKMTVYTWTK